MISFLVEQWIVSLSEIESKRINRTRKVNVVVVVVVVIIIVM